MTYTTAPVPQDTVAIVILRPGVNDSLEAAHYDVAEAVAYPRRQTALALRMLADALEKEVAAADGG